MERLFAELTDWPEYLQVFAGIFALVPPPVIVPVFLGIMAGRSEREKAAAAAVGSLGFLVAMVLFAFVGDAVLAVFGISLAAFRLAGGFLLLLIALDMMRADPHAEAEKAEGEARRGLSALTLGIVPLTMPILAGPGAMSAVVLFASEHEGFEHRVLVSVVLLVVALSIYLMLRAASLLDRIFTPNAALVVNKVMGLIIAAVAFEFIMHGIAGHFVQLDVMEH